MNSEIVIGIRVSDIDEVSNLLKPQVADVYERRESLYLGEYNLFQAPEELVVKYNYVAAEEEWDEPEFKDYEVLLVVGKTDRPNHFQKMAESLGIETKVIKCSTYG